MLKWKVSVNHEERYVAITLRDGRIHPEANYYASGTIVRNPLDIMRKISWDDKAKSFIEKKSKVLMKKANRRINDKLLEDEVIKKLTNMS